MRDWRWLLALTAVFFLATGCLSLETRVKVFQDGSGTYSDKVKLDQQLLDLAALKAGKASYGEMVAEALSSSLQSVEGIDGVRIMDMDGRWEEGGEIELKILYWFDSLEQWNRFAATAEKPRLELTARPEPKKRGEPERTIWTLDFVGNENPLAESAEAGSAPPSTPGMKEDVAGFRLSLEGPARAWEVPEPEDTRLRAALQENGGVEFSGAAPALFAKNGFSVTFAGRPLSPEELAAAKRKAQVEPSADYHRLVELVQQWREQEAVNDAARRAVTDTRFELVLTIDEHDLVQIASRRTYYGATAGLFAGREAVLQALMPEAEANYLTVAAPTEGDQPAGLVVTRRRREPLALVGLGDLLQKREDAGDIVYTVTIGALLAEVPATEEPLGRLIVRTPGRVNGTSGRKTGEHEATLELRAAGLVGETVLIVRTAPSE
jgi:aryl carrier-like protein